jgi:hypothetical protein
MEKKKLDEWKKNQIEKVFNRSNGTYMTFEYIENTAFFIKEINDFYKTLLESDDIYEELPNIIVKPLKCINCHALITNYDSIFVLSEDMCCDECKKND